MHLTQKLKYIVHRHFSIERSIQSSAVCALPYAMDFCRTTNTRPMMYIDVVLRYTTIIRYKAVKSYTGSRAHNICIIPNRSKNIICEDKELVIIGQSCKRIVCLRNNIILIKSGCSDIVCADNQLVGCDMYKCQNIVLTRNFIQIAGIKLDVSFLG